MNCSKCNTPLTDGAKFCLACGAPVEAPAKQNCPKCGNPNIAGARFCMSCGASMDIQSPLAASDNATLLTQNTPVQAAAPAPAPVEAPVSLNKFTEAAATAPKAPETAAEISTPTPEQQSAPVSSAEPNAAAVAVKPIKKKKTALWIVLSILGVLLVAALVMGFFFRGLLLNLILGNGKYAAQLEAQSILGAVDLVSSDENELSPAEFSQIASDTINSAAKAYRSASSAEEGDLSNFDLGGMISTYNETLMETYGTNGAETKYDVDINIDDALYSLFGLGDYTEDINDVISTINDAYVSMEAAADTDKMQAYMSVSDGNASPFDVKIIAQADGTVALTFPFASEKGIMMKLDTGEALEDLEVVVDIDKSKDLLLELAKIYLRHYSEAEVEIEKGELEIGGVNVEGRLILVDITDEKVGEMVAELIDYTAENEYFTSTILDIINYCGVNYTIDDLKADFNEAANKVKTGTNVSFKVQTIVDYNSNILGKSYSMTIDEETYGIGYADDGEEIGAAVFNQDADILTALITRQTENSGRIHFEANIGLGAHYGFNLDYTDAAIAEFGTGKVVVGDFHVSSGSKDADKTKSKFRAGTKLSVENGGYKNSMYIYVAGYADIALNTTVTPKNVEISEIPANLLDITDISSWTVDNEALQYLLDLLGEIQGSETFAADLLNALVEPLTEMAAGYLEELLADVIPDEVSSLLDQLDISMNDISAVIDIASNFCTADIVGEVQGLYEDISDCYEEISEQVEVVQENIEEYVEIVEDYVENADVIVDTVTEIAEQGADAVLPEQQPVAVDEDISLAEKDGFVGLWINEKTTSSTLEIKADGTVINSIAGLKSTSIWTYDGETFTIIEEIPFIGGKTKELKTVCTIEDGKLIMGESVLKSTYIKDGEVPEQSDDTSTAETDETAEAATEEAVTAEVATAEA